MVITIDQASVVQDMLKYRLEIQMLTSRNTRNILYSSTPLLAVSCQPDPVRSNQSNPTQGPFELLDPPDPHQVADVLQVGSVAQVDHASAPYISPEASCAHRILLVAGLPSAFHT